MLRSRQPRPALRPFVSLLWALDPEPVAANVAMARELVLPTGCVHIVLRLGDEPLRVFAHRDDLRGQAVGCALIGGARARPYFRDISRPAASVGALLYPGAAEAVIGAPAIEFSDRHTRLEDVWGQSAVMALREQLLAASSLESRLQIFESFLSQRLPRLRGIDPLIAHALTRFGAESTESSRLVADVVRDCGHSHRHFTSRFERAVGLTPKTWCRLVRFDRVLERLSSSSPALGLADIAAAEGYADQSHFIREFKFLGGLTPGQYLRRKSAHARHVTI